MVHSFEYEVMTDSRIVGGIIYGDYQLSIWDFGFFRRGQPKLLCLRIEQASANPPFPPTKAENFIFLASLFLRRRLVLGPLTRQDDKPLRLTNLPSELASHHTIIPPPSGRYVDVDIVRDPPANLHDLEAWLPLVDNLDNTRRENLYRAAKLYAEALELIEIRADVGYLNLVSAIESLAIDVDIGEPSLDDLREGWEDLVNKIADINLRQQFIGKLVEERYFRRKFVKFIEQHIENDQDFWAYERRPKGSGRIDKKNLKNILNNIYDQRSSTLHTGEPFPFYVFDRTTLPSLENYPEEGWLEKSITIHRQEMDEIPFTTLIYGGRTWKSKDFIPYPHFFERLVNHALKNYLQKNQPVADH